MTTQSHTASTNRCPHCNSAIQADPTTFFGEMDCLQCEVRLWYLTTADSARFFDFASTGDLQKRAIEIIAERFEVDEEKLAENPRLINEVATDSLESLELIMDLEEQLELV